MKLEFLTIAKNELSEAKHWYNNQHQGLGNIFLKEVQASLKLIMQYPFAYTSLDQNLRRCLIKKFPYSIIYGISDDVIVIVAIAHLHREPFYWVERLDE